MKIECDFDKQHGEENTKALRRTTALIGVLYIIGTVAGICSAVAKPYLDAPDYLVKVAGDATPVVLGAILVLTMGVALAIMSVLLYPILKEQNQTLAIGYVVFRGALETVTYMITTFCWLISAALGRATVQIGTDASALQAISGALTDPRAGSAITTIIFNLGALMFYSILYRSKLVPRWISSWGLSSTLPYFVSGILILFGVIDSGSATEFVLVLSMILQEIVLAVWMIAKGFNKQAIEAVPGDEGIIINVGE